MRVSLDDNKQPVSSNTTGAVPLLLLGLALRRLSSRPSLTLLSLLSIVLAIGMVVSIPVFSQGVSYLLLQDELAAISSAFRRPPLTMRFYYIVPKQSALSLDDALGLEDDFLQIVVNETGLAVADTLTYVASPGMTIQPLAGDTRYSDIKDNVIAENVQFAVVTDIQERIAIVEGRPYGEESNEGFVPVWLYEDKAVELGVQVGETYQMLDGSSGRSIPMIIAGIWQEADPSDFYWTATTISWQKLLLVTDTVYRRSVEPVLSRKTGIAVWYLSPDEDAMLLYQADSVANGLGRVPSRADLRFPGVKMDVSPEMPLNRYLQRRASLAALLVGFSLPALGLLLFFLWMLSHVTAQFQREEVAILSSRGAGRRFVAFLILLETFLLVAIGLPLGLGAGYLMARTMGLASGFLIFTRRSGIPATLLEVDWRLIGLALLLLALARGLPALRAARGGIVQHLRNRSRPSAAITTLLLVGDGAFIALTYYAYQQLSQRGTLGIIGWEPSGDPFRDPLLLLAPSLFVFTSALILTHLFPLLMGPLDRLGNRLRSFVAYMGLTQLHRQGTHYAGSLFLTMVCLSLGAFYASMALSLDQWLADRIFYQVGADFRFQQGIPPPAMGGPTSFGEEPNPEVISAWLLPVADYLEIPGVEDATRVAVFKADTSVSRRIDAVFLGIDRFDFPRVAFHRSDFNQASLGDLMNRLGMYPQGILVSRNFLQRSRLLEGQTTTLDISINYGSFEHEFMIVGVYDYFPTAYPQDTEVFVGNLNYVFEQVGDESLHQIWMKTNDDATPQTIVDHLLELGIWPIQIRDARSLLTLDEERVERIGLYGILSVGFFASTLLASLGLLVYTYASLQGRLQQISVLRAVGLKTRQVLAMVGVEYLGVILFGVFCGVGIGIATAYLFVPFFRVSGDPIFALPPFVRHVAWGQIGLLALIFGSALLGSQAIILYWITRRDLFQVLRMGQRE